METRVRYILVGLFALVGGAACVFFVLWLQNVGSFGSQRAIIVRFLGPTPGLQVGAAVAFNGIKVGEVAKLSLDRSDPNAVHALLSIDSRTPITATTRVAVDTEGLMGTVYVSLEGGTAGRPLAPPPGETTPVLVAPASMPIVEQAQSTLSQISNVLSDNAKPLHDIIANIQDFSAVLAHNSGRVDDILQGLERLTGGGSTPQAPPQTFDLAAPDAIDGFTPGNAVQLVVADPTSVVTLDTQRLLSQKPDGQFVIEPTQWSDSIPKLVQKKVLQTFGNVKYRFASGPTDGLNPEYQLLIDVQAFQIVASQPPVAEIRLGAQLLGHDGKISASQVVKAQAPATGVDGPAAVQAMNAAFASAARQLLLWYQSAVAPRAH